MSADAIYLRVSTKAQDTKSQEPDLKRWAAANGVDWSAAVYRDKFTGTSMDRPGFNKLMADIASGLVKRVVVWRIDRLGRTALGLVKLFADLEARKVSLVSLKDGFDLSTPAGRMMAHMLAGLAVYETEVRSERILAGQAAAKAAGKSWGGAVNAGRRIVVKPEQIAVVRSMKARGAKVAAMARATGLSRPTVYSVLKAMNPEARPGEGGGGDALSVSDVPQDL